MMRALPGIIVVAALAVWFGARPAQAKDYPGRYDIDGGGYYADEERDYRRSRGLEVEGTARAANPRTGPAVSLGGYQYAVTPPAPARVRVVVPTDAQVWLGDQETKQGGRERKYESPPLRPGRDYTYHVKVRWHDRSGNEVTRTRDVDVRANSDVTVDFLAGGS
jgi:uncharacterized protein (TIGR03000 family)